jgi:hypothetical protein
MTIARPIAVETSWSSATVSSAVIRVASHVRGAPLIDSHAESQSFPAAPFIHPAAPFIHTTAA